MRYLPAVVSFIGLISACTSLHSSSSIHAVHLNRAEVLNHISAGQGGATFVSGNGHMFGTDSDAEITFAENNRIRVTEYRDAIETYVGNYSVDEAGAIHVSLRHYPRKWPSMYLRKEGRGAILFPTDQDPALKLGGRAGAVKTAGMASYWPFRQTH